MEKVITTTLILGATGATGRLLVRQLIEKNQNVRAIVRSKDKLVQECLGDFVFDKDKLTVVEGTVLDMSDDEIKDLVDGCDAVVSCLGHNVTINGMFFEPRRLVKDSIARVCDVVKELKSTRNTKIVLMGSVGVANPDGSDDVRTVGDRIMLGILRKLLPPHADNEEAAAYLSESVGKRVPQMQWIIVRPSNLIDADVSEYELVSKPTGSLFGGKTETSRANVAAFMCELILHEESWKKWMYQSPVVLNV